MRNHVALLILIGALVVGWTGNSHAQTLLVAKAPGISSSEIVSRMMSMNEKRAAALKGFTSERTYDLDYSGFPSHKHAKMVIDVTFKAPQDKQLNIVSEEGSELLRKTNANYEFSLVGREEKDGRNCFILEVKPRAKSKFLYEGRVWVDVEEFAVVHIQARPAKNPSFWVNRAEIEHRYEKVGQFWLPVSNRSTSSTRLGGHATLAIDYGSYKVEPPASSASQQIPAQGGSQ